MISDSAKIGAARKVWLTSYSLAEVSTSIVVKRPENFRETYQADLKRVA